MGADTKFGTCIDINTDNAYIVGREASTDVAITVLDFYGAEVNTRTISSTGTETGFDCVIDSAGALVIVGRINGAAFDGVVNPNAGVDTGLIAKYLTSDLSVPVFVNFIVNDDSLSVPGGTGTNAYVSANFVDVDSSNNYYVTGSSFAGFDGNPMLAPGVFTAYFAKFDSSGSRIYITTLQHTLPTTGLALCVDEASDAVYMAGNVRGDLYDPAQPGSSLRGSVTKATASTGAVLSGVITTAGSDDYAWGCDLDSSGNIYITGQSNSLQSAYATKYDSTLALQWNYNFGTANDFAQGIAVGSDNYAYVVGSTSQTTFQGYSIPNATGQSMFLAKLTPAGMLEYAVGYSSSGNDGAIHVALDSYENAVVVGFAGGAIGSNTHVGSTDFFAFAYGDPYPTAGPTPVPTCQVVEVESAHPYSTHENNLWEVQVPGWSCYKITMDPLSWTPEKYDFLRINAVDELDNAVPVGEKRLYKRRLRNFGTVQVQASKLVVKFRSDYVRFRNFIRDPWPKKNVHTYGFRLEVTCCNEA